MREAAWGPVWQGNPFAPIRIATCACEWKRGLAANPRSPIRAHVNTPLGNGHVALADERSRVAIVNRPRCHTNQCIAA